MTSPTDSKDGDTYYITSSGCPYSSQFPTEPNDLRKWERLAMDQLEEGWRKSGEPQGVTVNDHSWVKLGQGNTVGFIAGSLSIGNRKEHDLSQLEEACRQGMFAKPGDYPAIIRFSDFGKDDGSKLERLSRMAVKIHSADAWRGEINFTTAETIEQFSLDNFESIAHFVGDPNYTSFLKKFGFLASKAGIALNSSGDLAGEWKSGEVLSKTFYSQLAYLLGPEHAFKYRFVAMQNPIGDVEDSLQTSRSAMRHWLSISQANFQLEIQVNDDPGSDLVQKEASETWDAPWIPVGVLTLSRQATDEDGVGIILRDALADELNLSREQKNWLHKSFLFHPLLTNDAHMPVGETQHFRSHFYPRAAQQRFALLSTGTIDPQSMPFNELAKIETLQELFTPSTASILWSIDEPEAFSEMDHYTKMLCKLIPPKVFKANALPLTDDSLVSEDIDLFGPQESDVIKVGSATIKLMKEDDGFGELSLIPWLTLRTLRTEMLLPIDDIFVDCSSDEARAIEQHLGLTQSLPKPTHQWDEMSSDEALSRMFFNGVGAVILTSRDEDETRYVADTGALAALEMRPGFHPYGTCAHFDSQRKLIKIYDYANKQMITPKDPGWAHAKYLTKQSLAMSVTGGQHLLWTHFLVANTMINAKTTCLPVNHPVRRLLVPFSFRTTFVNNRAKDSLLPEFSMFHHATGMTYEGGVTTLVSLGAQQCDFWRPFPETASKLGPELNALAVEGHFPYITDGLAYYETVLEFVNQWLSSAYADDAAVNADKEIQNFWAELSRDTTGMEYAIPPELGSISQLAGILAQFIFVVTAMHDLVGSVVEYIGVDRCGFRARPNETQTDVQSWLIASCLMSTTSIRTPALLGSSFSNYFSSGFETETWADFQQALQVLADANDALNESREHECLNFNPRVLECAISV